MASWRAMGQLQLHLVQSQEEQSAWGRVCSWVPWSVVVSALSLEVYSGLRLRRVLVAGVGVLAVSDAVGAPTAATSLPVAAQARSQGAQWARQ